MFTLNMVFVMEKILSYLLDFVLNVLRFFKINDTYWKKKIYKYSNYLWATFWLIMNIDYWMKMNRDSRVLSPFGYSPTSRHFFVLHYHILFGNMDLLGYDRTSTFKTSRLHPSLCHLLGHLVWTQSAYLFFCFFIHSLHYL